MEDKIIESRKIDPDATKAIDLMDAVRRARVEQAEKSGIASDLRAAEFTRLEFLSENLAPILAQLPRDAELFNHGLVPGERPRYYVDMIAFIEMGRDRRTYRFLMDTPSGRQVLGESNDIPIMVHAITNYLARRLVEREFALQHAMSFETSDKHTANQPLELEHSESISTLPVITEIRRPDGSRLLSAFIIGIVAGIVAVYAGVHWDTSIVPEFDRLLGLIVGR
jgi:hypothetical protein